MTPLPAPRPDDPFAADRPGRSPAERDRARVKLTRKWAYLISMTAYIPLVPTDLERPLRELVDTVFAAVAGDTEDAAETAAEVGTRLVKLNCVDRKSLQCTVDVLAPALLADQDLRRLDRLAERVVRVLGAVSGGFAEAIRRRTTEQQDSMCRALLAVARKATADAEARASSLDEVSTELSLLQRQLGHQLLHDPLTGLPNRQFFTTRLEEVLNSGDPITLYRLALNGFPLITAGVGRERGELLLRAAAARIRVAAGEAAMVARFDGAQFAILREGTAEPAAVVGEIERALAEPTYVEEETGLATTANIGVVQRPPHGAEPAELLHAAELALRNAKRNGPGQWVLHAPDEHAADRGLLRLAATMPGAWESGQVKVGYRLRIGLSDGNPVGVDAFVSWRAAERAGQPRHQCVDLAERTGLSQQLGPWLLHNASAQLRSWSTASGSDLPLAVNLSPNQASRPDLVDTVLGVLDDTALPGERLLVAMPAAEVFTGRERAAANLTSLAAAGVRTGVHDFGGGAGDAVHLEDLPLHAVRLSPRLVSRAVGSATDSVAARALTGLVALTHLAGLPVWVDGVRSRREVAWWQAANADIATGPAFSSPGTDDAADIATLFTDAAKP
ncbi:EAL domain-containing protein [Actinophytocola sediminis]